MLPCENKGYKYTFPGGNQQCFWASSTYAKSRTEAADLCGSNGGSLALIQDPLVSVHIANLIMLTGFVSLRHIYHLPFLFVCFYLAKEKCTFVSGDSTEPKYLFPLEKS
jgi:hypothetical protein